MWLFSIIGNNFKVRIAMVLKSKTIAIFPETNF